MANILKKTIDLGGYATTLWSLVPATAQTTITTGLTIVTAYFGYQELGLARAIFFATGVMAFGMATTFLWFRISQIAGTFQRLSIIGIYVPNASVESQRAKAINTQVAVRNDSQMMMFYRLRRMHHSFNRIGPKESTVDKNIVPLSPGGTATINFATVEDVPFPDKKHKLVSGEHDIEIEYGSAIDDLKFLLHYRADLQVVFSPIQNSKEFRIDSMGALKLFEHKRA